MVRIPDILLVHSDSAHSHARWRQETMTSSVWDGVVSPRLSSSQLALNPSNKEAGMKWQTHQCTVSVLPP